MPQVGYGRGARLEAVERATAGIAGHGHNEYDNGVYGSSGPPGVLVIGFDGSGIVGFSTIGPGVSAWSEHDVGLLGVGKLVGGAFEGGQAQITLVPGSRTTHPVKGTRGDLYVDRSGRLWYCKIGGKHATWHQLA